MPSSNNFVPPASSTLSAALRKITSILRDRKIPYAIIGGIAMVQHTRARATDDIDILLTLPGTSMPGLFESLGTQGFQVDLPLNVRELCDQGLTSIFYQHVIIDLLQPIIPSYAHILDRAVGVPIAGQECRVASPEGLIVSKLIAMRPQDEDDIRNLLAAYPNLDLEFIRKELATFVDPDHSTVRKFEKMLLRS